MPESKCSGLFDKAPLIGYAAASNISCTFGQGSGLRFLNGAASASVMRLKIAVLVDDSASSASAARESARSCFTWRLPVLE